MKDELYEQMFVTFWKNYPRKDGKIAAKKKFISILKRVDGDKQTKLLEKIAAGLVKNRNAYDQRDEGDYQFFPMAITWLNQERWEDYNDEV